VASLLAINALYVCKLVFLEFVIEIDHLALTLLMPFFPANIAAQIAFFSAFF
jgi:hypothetical protein